MKADKRQQKIEQPPQTKKKKKFRWWNILLVAAALFFCVRLGMQVNEYFALQEEAEYYREVLSETEDAYQEQLEKEELLNNESYLERVAREKLGMVKEGETVVSTTKTEQTQTDAEDQTDEEDKEDKDSSDKSDKEE